MDLRLKGAIFIFLGIFLIFLAGSKLIIRAIIIGLGLYLVFCGLKLRNVPVFFYIHRFINRF